MVGGTSSQVSRQINALRDRCGEKVAFDLKRVSRRRPAPESAPDPYPPRIETSRKPKHFRAFPFAIVHVRSRSIQVNHGPIMGHGRRLSERVAA